MSDIVLVVSTAPSVEVAGKIAKTLLNEKLCACANVVPAVKSIYWWKGKLEEEQEAMLFLKTDAALGERLCERLVEVHPYDVPEAIVLEVAGGNPDYLRWVRKCCRGK